MHVRHYGLHLTALALAVTAEAGAQQPSVGDRVRAALQLPRIADSVRKHGGSERDVGIVFDEVKKRNIPATETRDVLQATDASLKEHGPVNNFGAFVQSQLASGRRGRELSQAIRAEHARRGIGGGQQRNTKTRGAPDSARATRGKAAATPTTKGPQSGIDRAKAARDDAKAKAKTGTTTKSPTKATTKTPTKTKGARP
jgi:hypothetical protein